MFRLPNIVNYFRRSADTPVIPDDTRVRGLDGTPSPSTRFGLADNKWAEVGKLSSGLPWDLKFGLLSSTDVANAKGDHDAMVAQVAIQKEYLGLQEKMVDRWEEIQGIQAELAKITMDGRYSVAQLDAKTAQKYYDHMGRMRILQQENLNSASLAQYQQSLGIQLANHKLGNSNKLLRDEFEAETNLGDAQYQQKRQSLVDRFRTKKENLARPRSRPASEVEPTPGRVLQFGRRAS